jgi:2-polyprenyl-6-methoxyphenol hydroxylase-like FAD-dependent oxidoreductase
MLESALVIGAGIAGMAAARVLSDFSRQVLVLEKDLLSDEPRPRQGVAQGPHVHGLLAGGCARLSEMFAGFEADLVAADVAPRRAGRDLRFFRAGAWVPGRDVGLTVYSQTRPLLEHLIRRRLTAIANVEVRSRCATAGLISDGTARIAGVAVREADGGERVIDADLVIDASGRGSRACQWLAKLGFGQPRASIIRVEQRYVSCLFRAPAGYSEAEPFWRIWDAPSSTRTGTLQPVEGQLWLVTLGSRFGDYPPLDVDGMIAFAASLPRPQIAERMRAAAPATRPTQYHFASNVHWHYEEMSDLPEGFLPIGDAMMSLNPVWGQGMTTALLQAGALAATLERRAGDRSGLGGLAGEYLPRVAELLAYPWRVAAVGDFAYEQTTGDRPPDLEEARRFNRGLAKLVEEDPEVHRLSERVRHLLDPPELLASSGIRERVLALS